MKFLFVFLSLLAFACAAPTPVPSTDSEPEPAPAAAPSTAASAPAPASPAAPASEATTPSCAGKPGRAGDISIGMTSGGRSREAILHVPASYDGSQPLPVVLVLHPLMLDHIQMRELTQMDRFTEEGRGFIALYPNGIEKSWNAGEVCCGKALEEKVDDVAFIRELLAEVSRTHCVDATRIFSTGFSNGAFLSNRLACDLGETIRAVVPVGGTIAFPPTTSCKRTTPLPILAIHGTADKLAPFEGGKPGGGLGILNRFFKVAGEFPSAAAADAFWAKHNGNDTTPTVTSQKGAVTCRTHAGPAPVTLCTVEGGGHQWFGHTIPLPLVGGFFGDNTTDVDASEAAVKFFREQGL